MRRVLGRLQMFGGVCGTYGSGRRAGTLAPVALLPRHRTARSSIRHRSFMTTELSIRSGKRR